jgi:cytochrome b561
MEALMARYPLASRILHWAVAAAMVGLVPIGAWMADRGAAGQWDGLTNTLYVWHKAIGFAVLWLVVVRILIRRRSGTPPYPQALSRRHRVAATALHHMLYLLLVLVPLLGWAGVTAYPALVTVGGLHLPPLPWVPQDQALAARLFAVHGALAILLAVLALGHAAAALNHLLLRKDGLFQRMWFGGTKG